MIEHLTRGFSSGLPFLFRSQAAFAEANADSPVRCAIDQAIMAFRVAGSFIFGKAAFGQLRRAHSIRPSKIVKLIYLPENEEAAMTNQQSALKIASMITSIGLILSAAAIATNASAQTAPVPDHPRVNEVN